ncbi:MAG: hypothetical protein R3C49_11590 [Planctomycetaceae bacterium]
MFRYITRNLTPEHFQRFAIWADYDTPEDLETVSTWGADGADIANELKEAGLSDAWSFPLLQLDDGWQGHRGISIGVTIVAADGTSFCGYICGEIPHCLALFLDNHTFSFNRNAPDWAAQTLMELRSVTGAVLSPFFPLQYRAIAIPGLRQIEGAFHVPPLTT